jgi:hypothetical protein
MISSNHIMNLNQSVNALQVTLNTSPTPFPFLNLPGEIRNLIYSFVSAQTEADVVFPIIKKPQAPGLPTIQGKS